MSLEIVRILKTALRMVAIVFFCLLILPTIQATPQGDKKEVRDEPAKAAQFRMALLRTEAKVIPNDALPKAIARVREMRREVAQRHNIAPGAMAAFAMQGKPHLVGGIPVGPLAGFADQTTNEIHPQTMPLAAVGHINPSGWKWHGPGNIGGRIRSIVIHPQQPNIIWIGAVNGGVWKSINAGLTWTPLYDFMASLAISCMVLDPTNSDVLFVGTGEGFYNADASRGFGIFKSENGGTTWSQLASTADTHAEDFRYVNRIAMARISDQSTLFLVATRTGLFRSTDKGQTFQQLDAPVKSEILDVHIDPTDCNKCICSSRNGQAYFSTDAGQTWTKATGIQNVAGFGGRVELGYAQANPSVVYASVDQDKGVIYRSVDGGKTYTQRGSADHLSGQGWYANTLWATDPTDPNFLLVGGLDLYRSTDGGNSFTQISRWQDSPKSAHADHHAIVHHPGYNGTTNKTVFFGNDGGIYRVTDVSTLSTSSGWESLNHGLGITQFYGAGANLQSGRLVAGAQDNGTLFFNPDMGSENWKEVFGGDGGASAADPASGYYYGEYVYLQIHRGKDGNPHDYIYDGIDDAGKDANALFIAPFVLDPSLTKRMYAGGSSSGRSDDVMATTPSWKRIVKPVIDQLISTITVHPNNSNTIWVGHEAGTVYLSKNCLSNSPTWTSVSTGLPARFCTRLIINPATPASLFATFGGYSKGNLFKSSDEGQSWNPLGINALPEAPCYDLAIHPDDPKTLIVGTDVGLFVSDDGGTTWSPTNQGPTNCPVYQLFWMKKKLVAVTHGRGIFSIDLTLPAPAPAGPTVPKKIAP